jgi:hypothetical protein
MRNPRPDHLITGDRHPAPVKDEVTARAVVIQDKIRKECTELEEPYFLNIPPEARFLD